MSETTRVILTTVLPSLLAEAATRALEERPLPPELGQRSFRRATVADGGYDAENHTVTMAVSSEYPVQRYGGDEILSHQPNAIQLDRLKQGIALLFNHDYDQHLGRSTGYDLSGGVLRITNRFGTNPLAREKEQDVADGILTDVSIGYQPLEYDITEDKTGYRTYTVTKWELYENSLVTVPADPTVGVDRAAPSEIHVKVNFRKLDEAESPAPDTTARRSTDDEKDEDGDEEVDDPDDPEAGERTAAAPTTSTITETTTRTQTMATAAVVADPHQQNNERIAGLRSLHAQYPEQFNERALKAAESLDVSVETAKARIADLIITGSERSNVPTIADEMFDSMTDKDLTRFSLAGAYRAAYNQAKPGTFKDKMDGGFEREIGEDLRKRASDAGVTMIGGGIVIPSSTSRSLAIAMQKRAIASGGNAGTMTNFTTVEADPIELLRFKVSALALGARFMTGLHGAIQIPRQNAAGTSNWVPEGTNATETDPTLNKITMSPKHLTMFNSYYLDFLAQSNLAIEAFLANDRMEVLKRSLNTAFIAGTGVAPVPLGLLNQTGLAAVLAGTTRAANGTVTAGQGGVPMTYVDYNNLEAAISTANGDIGTMGIIMTPKVRAAGRSTPKIPGTASEFIFPDSKVGANGIQEGPLGYNTIATSDPCLMGFSANSVNNLHAVIAGVFDQGLIGDWGLSELIVDMYTGAASGLTNFIEHAFYDTNVRHVESFAACTSALPL